MRKFVRVLTALAAEAAGGLIWLCYGFWFGKNEFVRGLAKHFFGWYDPEMEAHHARLAASKGFHERFESYKNLTTEWNRLDARRGGKLFTAGMLLVALGSATIGHFL
jgi:hypothetical protein